MARPRIEISDAQWLQVEKMARIMCTGEEIADVLNMSYDTLERRVKEKYDVSFADYIKQFWGDFKSSLRRAQAYTAINKKNPTMQIWLGKQYLNQKDRQEIEGRFQFESITDMLEQSEARKMIDITPIDDRPKLPEPDDDE